jgi:hypothetical protein
MSRFEANLFAGTDEVEEWLQEMQPIHWQVVQHGSGSTYEYAVFAEFAEGES